MAVLLRIEAASLLAEKVGGLEANFLLQIKGRPFAYSGFSFSGKIWLCVGGVLMKEQAGIGPWELMCRKGHGGEKDLGAFLLSLKSPTCWNLGALLQRCLKPPLTFSSVGFAGSFARREKCQGRPVCKQKWVVPFCSPLSLIDCFWSFGIMIAMWSICSFPHQSIEGKERGKWGALQGKEVIGDYKRLKGRGASEITTLVWVSSLCQVSGDREI